MYREETATPEDIEYVKCNDEMDKQLLEQFKVVERVIGEFMCIIMCVAVLMYVVKMLAGQRRGQVKSTYVSGRDYHMQSQHGKMPLSYPYTFKTRLMATASGMTQIAYPVKAQR